MLEKAVTNCYNENSISNPDQINCYKIQSNQLKVKMKKTWKLE